MTSTHRRPARRNESRDLAGRLATQSGPRTTAPMWARPFFTPGEWAVYTALWSYPNDAVVPTYQELCDRAWVERPTAIAAVTKMNELGLLEKEASERDYDGGQDGNVYYLIEIPTPELRAKIAEKVAERQKEQEAKRKKRKAANRKYEKPQVTASQGGAISSDPLYKGQGGYVESDPRGVDPDSTPGGSVQISPQGVGLDSTHKTLGVTEVLEVTVSSTSSSPEKTEEPISSNDQKDQEQNLSETADDVKAKEFWPELTDWETALHQECLSVAGARWSSSSLRKVIGSRTVREITARDPELVRRAFLVGAKSRKGITVPMRMWYIEECPHWRTAERELTTEREAAQKPADAPGTDQGSEITQQPQPAAPAPAQRAADPGQPRSTMTRSAALAEARAVAAAASTKPVVVSRWADRTKGVSA